MTSAIGTLKGPLHGGANEGVIHMLLEIGSEDNVDAWVEEQLAQKKKIMGMAIAFTRFSILVLRTCAPWQ